MSGQGRSLRRLRWAAFGHADESAPDQRGCRGPGGGSLVPPAVAQHPHAVLGVDDLELVTARLPVAGPVRSEPPVAYDVGQHALAVGERLRAMRTWARDQADQSGQRPSRQRRGEVRELAAAVVPGGSSSATPWPSIQPRTVLPRYDSSSVLTACMIAVKVGASRSCAVPVPSNAPAVRSGSRWSSSWPSPAARPASADAWVTRASNMGSVRWRSPVRGSNWGTTVTPAPLPRGARQRSTPSRPRGRHSPWRPSSTTLRIPIRPWPPTTARG